ncbi:hypothetical protein I7I48_06880 [Histoplasma ohiense]|nr:hypothetical protein I7I48_06880 [Histoplasma ohiense (nom. inval.)]
MAHTVSSHHSLFFKFFNQSCNTHRDILLTELSYLQQIHDFILLSIQLLHLFLHITESVHLHLQLQ